MVSGLTFAYGIFNLLARHAWIRIVELHVDHEVAVAVQLDFIHKGDGVIIDVGVQITVPPCDEVSLPTLLPINAKMASFDSLRTLASL